MLQRYWVAGSPRRKGFREARPFGWTPLEGFGSLSFGWIFQNLWVACGLSKVTLSCVLVGFVQNLWVVCSSV